MFQEGFGTLNFLKDRTLPALAAVWNERQPVAWLMALLIGAVAAYAILAFRKTIGLVRSIWLGSTSDDIVATLAAMKAPWIIALAPVIGGIVVGLLLFWVMPGRRAEGIADIIEARAFNRGRMPLRAGLVSALISAISLGSGASAGREGPAVHLGASVASAIGEWFRLPSKIRRVLLACGSAAAVSASFNAPIAGVVFAHEVILGHYGLRAFVPTVVSSVVATIITRFHLGGYPAFIVPPYSIASLWEFPAFALLGITCGIVAVCFNLGVIAADAVARRIDMPLWLRPALGGLAVGLIALAVPEVLGVGYEATNRALNHQYGLIMLFVLLGAKTLATAITLASRFGGGVFSPSLYLGAMAGGAFGLIAAAAYPGTASSAGVYSILGMGAVAGAVLGAPLSSVLIVFELTGGYEMTIALLLSVSISTLVMQALLGQSFFGWQLRMRGRDVTGGPHREIMQSLLVAEFYTPLSEEELANPPEIFEGRPTLRPDDNLETALRAFAEGDYSRIAVMEPPKGGVDPRHIGWADYSKALSAYNASLVEASIEEHR